jgi:NitT/TauT family transport system permease protein
MFGKLEVVDTFWIGSPGGALASMVDLLLQGTAFIAVWITISDALLGLAIGLVLACVLVLALTSSQFVEEVLQPFIDFVYAIPKVALIPVLVLVFGIGRESKIILIVLLTAFIFVYNIREGVRDVDRRLISAMRIMKATNRDIMLHVRIPLIASYVIAGLRIALPAAITGAIFAEYFSGQAGIGKVVYDAAISFQIDTLLAGVLTLVPVTLLLEYFVRRTERSTSAWRDGR